MRIFVTGLIHFLPHAGNIFQRHFARHDQAFRHFAAFRQTLRKNQLVRTFLTLRHTAPASEKNRRDTAAPR